jgi:hypothetical protein
MADDCHSAGKCTRWHQENPHCSSDGHDLDLGRRFDDFRPDQVGKNRSNARPSRDLGGTVRNVKQGPPGGV